MRNLWLDCNSDQLGGFNDENSRKLGKLVAPDLDWDPQNPTGIEINNPVVEGAHGKKTGFTVVPE